MAHAQVIAAVRITIALAGASVFPSSAHPQRPPVDGPPPSFKAFCEDAEALRAAQAAFLEAKVIPKPGQQSVWNAFLTAWLSADEPLRRRCNAPAAPPLDPGALLREQHQVFEELGVVQRLRRAAVERIMPELTSEQQFRLAEALLVPPGAPLSPMRRP